MSTYRLFHFSCPRILVSLRSFTLALGLMLACIVPCGVTWAAPAETAVHALRERPHSGSLETSGPALNVAPADSASSNASKTEPAPPAEEDPEVDEIDPLVGGWDGLLVRWLKEILGLKG